MHKVTPTTSPPPSTIFLLDYRNRGAAQISGNIGDQVQTVAMMRIITKWLRLWDLVRRCRGLPDALPNVATCPRDEAVQIHPGALLLLYGWHMHKAASGVYEFPPRTERAIATSFHVHSDALLTPAAVGYLRRIGPVGCRDLSTLRKLRAKQIPSFYSGCVTLTLPKAPGERRRSGAVAVDTVSPDPAASKLAMWAPANRRLSQRQMWLRAVCVIRLLRRTRLVYSSRLHVLYPCLAMGTPAIMQAPGGDARTDWGAPGRWETARLYASGVKDHVLDAKRLERQLAAALGRAMAGEDITRAWRRAVVIHVAFCFDAGFAIPTLACANSLLVNNGERPLFLHFFHRGVQASDISQMQQRLLAKHPGTMMEFHECEGNACVRYGTHLPHVSAQTMERLWLHEKLPDVDRLIYLDGDMIVRGPLDELFDKSVPVIAARNSIDNIMLSSRWNRGLGYAGSSCFNAGLLILNLAALRRMDFTGFVHKVLELQECNDQTILNLFCQGKHTPLRPEYNYYVREPKDTRSGIDPVIVHYCGSQKPWNTESMHMAGEWHKYRL